MERAQVVARVSHGHYHLVSRIASDAHRRMLQTPLQHVKFQTGINLTFVSLDSARLMSPSELCWI
jgi:hypothetical protein